MNRDVEADPFAPAQHTEREVLRMQTLHTLQAARTTRPPSFGIASRPPAPGAVAPVPPPPPPPPIDDPLADRWFR